MMNVSSDTYKKIAMIEKLFRLDDREMYDYQGKTAIYLDTYKKVITNKTRQGGLSDLFAAYGLVSAVMGEICLVTSPSQRQSNKVMDFAHKWSDILQDHFTMDLKEDSKTMLSIHDAGEFLSLPNSPSTVRGYRAHHLILDEFAHFLHGTDKEMWTAILPSISRGGSLAVNSTPFGTENKYYEMWNNVDNRYNIYKRILINWQDCPDLDEAEIQEVKLSDPPTYAQEYNNQFLEEVDEAEFPFSLIQSCIDMELEFEELSKKKIYRAGCDIGRRRDLTAIAFFERVKEKYILRKTEMFLNKKYRWQEDHIRFLLKNYTFENFTIDATGIGNQLAEDLHEDFGDVVKPLEFSNENKQEMVIGLKELMHDKNISYPNDPMVINNIRAIKRQYTTGGFLKFDADRTSEIGHADLFWGIALALYKPSMGTADFYIG